LMNPPPASRVGVFTWSGQLIGNHHCGVVGSLADVDVIKGVNFAFRREAIPAMFIDRNLVFRGAEVGWEVDICCAIKRAGWRIFYFNDFWVNHHVGMRSDEDNRAMRDTPVALRRVFNMAYLIFKHRPPVSAAWYFLRHVLIGNRQQPGIVMMVLLVAHGDWKAPSLAFKIARQLFVGACNGYRSRV